MHQSKLVEALRTFSSRDLRRFGEYLSSPYFNKNEELPAMYRQLRNCAPAFAPDKTERHLLWRKVFPGIAFDEKKCAYLMNQMLRLAEQFLAQEQYESDPERHLVDELNACNLRNLDKHYDQIRRRLDKEMKDSPLAHSRRLYLRYLAAESDALYFHRKQQRRYDRNLQEAVDLLDDYYLAAKLRLSCELINRQNILSATYDIRLVDMLLGYLEHYDLSRNHAAAVYRQVLLILTEAESDAHWKELKTLLARHREVFPVSEQRELYSYAQNYCIRRIRGGGEAYMEELFDIYGEMLDSGILIEEGYLSPWKYKNIVSVALRLGRFEWTDRFIHAYIDKLHEEFRESAMAYNLANLRYHQRRHEEALRHLMQVEFTDVYYSLDTRKMMLRIYYEQDETEALLSLIASFRIFLRRNKLIAEGTRQAYLNFVSGVQTLFRAREAMETPQDLRESILALRPVTDEDWLIAEAEKVV